MSTIKVNAIQNSSGVEVYTAKAWVNFNGVGTVAIRASGNVSSITDNGVGDYTVNFTNAMPDANYTFSGNVGAAATAGPTNGSVVAHSLQTNFATTSCRIYAAVTTNNTAYDPLTYSAAFFR
jgi:hypothetical protein